jgi:hippurate hydrolase
MAKSSELDLIIEGKSAHCASSEQAVDALAIGCELVGELYKMEKEELSVNEYRLLKFGKTDSGTVRNAISGKTVLEGSVRCFHEKAGVFLFRRIRETTAVHEEKYGCRITMVRSDGHPAVINDPKLFEEAKILLSEYNFLAFEKPFMQAEDFSCYQKEVPGLYLFLGTGTNIPLHNDRFDFDEEVLLTGVNIYLKLLKEVRL